MKCDGPLLRRISRGDDAHLQAVALKAHVAGRDARVVERGRIVPAGEQVQVLGVVHGVEPDAHFVACRLDVAANQDAARQIPIVRAAVDRDLSRRRQDLHAQVFGFGGVADSADDECGQQREQEQGSGFRRSGFQGCDFLGVRLLLAAALRFSNIWTAQSKTPGVAPNNSSIVGSSDWWSAVISRLIHRDAVRK